MNRASTSTTPRPFLSSPIPVCQGFVSVDVDGHDDSHHHHHHNNNNNQSWGLKSFISSINHALRVAVVSVGVGALACSTALGPLAIAGIGAMVGVVMVYRLVKEGSATMYDDDEGKES